MSASFRRRHLPHYDVDNASYFITTCLAGSLPARGRLRDRVRQSLDCHTAAVATTAPPVVGDAAMQEHFASMEEWLDDRPIVRWLNDRRLAGIVARELHEHVGTWYDLHAYVIMPSHAHWICTPRPAWQDALRRSGRNARVTLMRAIKGRTARACNQVLGREGPFWQSESYDRVVRGIDELERLVRYVEYNPVKAGLCARPEEWEFSSAK
jgi:putative transposase